MNIVQSDVVSANVGGGYSCQATDVIPCMAGDTISVQHVCSTTGLNGWVGANIAFLSVRALS